MVREGYEPVLKNKCWCLLKRPENLTDKQRLSLRELLCEGCGHQCSLTAGTILQNAKLPLRTWFLAMQLIGSAKNGIAALDQRRQLGVSYPTAWMRKHKVSETMYLAEQDRQLDGRIMMDDAFLGGERSCGKPGRGSES